MVKFMKELLEFLLKGILGDKKFKISEEEADNHQSFVISVPKEEMGIVIGKGGKIIRALRNILKVRATLEKKAVSLEVAEAN